MLIFFTSNLPVQAIKEGFQEMNAGRARSNGVSLEELYTIYGMGSHLKEKILAGIRELEQELIKKLGMKSLA
jgi:hypothetical protein